MMLVKNYFIGNIHQTYPHLSKWVFSLMIIGGFVGVWGMFISTVLLSMVGWFSFLLAYAIGGSWESLTVYWNNRLYLRMIAHPEQYFDIGGHLDNQDAGTSATHGAPYKETRTERTTAEFYRKWWDIDGTIHCLYDPSGKMDAHFLEIHNDHDRVLFRLGL